VAAAAASRRHHLAAAAAAAVAVLRGHLHYSRSFCLVSVKEQHYWYHHMIELLT
jgi:hypothetical protein